MFCAISGEVPTEPVVSSKTGHLFEKKLILKYLASEDKCPVTGGPLQESDLVGVVAAQAARPRPITSTSIPGLLSHFQNEWDAVMLESFTLKQHLDSTRQELSQVLYQHDAACRVIARLTRERDEARAMVGAGQSVAAQHAAAAIAGGGGPAAAEGMDVDGGAAAAAAAGMTDAVLAALTAKAQELTKTRKKRPVPPTLATAADIGSYAEKASVAPHATKTPGITCIDLHPTLPLTVSGGADKTACVFDHAKGQSVATLSGHTKKVTSCTFHRSKQGLVLTGSADKTVRLWDASSGDGAAKATIEGFGGEVSGVSVHPTGDYAAVSGKDGSWSFASLNYATVLEKVPGSSSSAYNGVCFHPDGLLLGLAGDNKAAEIWDVKTQKKIHAFEGHGGAVTALDFSENGYLMASCSADGEVKLWDLRKLKNLHTLALPGTGASGLCVTFDHSGSFLAAGSGNGQVVVQAVKEWSPVSELKAHSKECTGLAFNFDATALATCSLDRTVKLWGK